MKDIYKLSYSEIDSLYSVQAILRECGVKKLVDKGGYFSFSSPFREDKNPSMVLYKDTLGCIDFAGDFKGNLFSFVKQSLGQSLYDFIGTSTPEILEKKYFAGVSKIKGEAFIKPNIGDFKMVIHSGEINYDFSKNPQAKRYIEKRFMTEEFIKFFHIGFTTFARVYRAPKSVSKVQKGTAFANRICIPIYLENHLISYEGRDYTGKCNEENSKVKKVLYPKGGLNSYLFNYDNLDKDEPLIVVEGIMDLVRIWTSITKNVTTTFGNLIKENQKEQLKQFKHIILLSDTDKGGRQMISNLDQFYEDDYWIAQLPTGDPGDAFNSVEDIKFAIDTAKDASSFFLEESELFIDTEITPSSFFKKM